MKNDLLTILARMDAYDEERAVKGSTLAKILSTTPRHINTLARELRQDGYRVISSKSSTGGYYITDDIGELEHFYKSHKSQSDKHLEECNLVNSLIINRMNELDGCSLYPQKKSDA